MTKNIFWFFCGAQTLTHMCNHHLVLFASSRYLASIDPVNINCQQELSLGVPASNPMLILHES